MQYTISFVMRGEEKMEEERLSFEMPHHGVRNPENMYWGLPGTRKLALCDHSSDPLPVWWGGRDILASYELGGGWAFS